MAEPHKVIPFDEWKNKHYASLSRRFRHEVSTEWDEAAECEMPAISFDEYCEQQYRYSA